MRNSFWFGGVSLVALIIALGGCQTVEAVARAYCDQVAGPGKAVIRDRLTGGVQVIDCAALD